RPRRAAHAGHRRATRARGQMGGQGPGAHLLRHRPCVTYTAVWNYVGYPAAALPAGFDENGMPTAVQLVAPSGRETTLLSLAAQTDKARPWARPRPPLPQPAAAR